MDYGQYDAWSENARLARMEYLKGKLAARESWRRRSFYSGSTPPMSWAVTKRIRQSWWRRWSGNAGGAGDFSFDPETYYPEMIQVLDLGAAEPKWETYTAVDLRKQEQQGHQSLREKYGKR